MSSVDFVIIIDIRCVGNIDDTIPFIKGFCRIFV